MSEYVTFPTLITKGLEFSEADGRRIFKGHITAEIIDKQQEFIFVEEVMKIMDIFMKTNPVMSEVHTNRMVGIVLDYEKSEINGVASVLITGEIYKVDGISLYDRVWAKILSKEYRGLSMGGASKEREPIEKDGRMALELRKLELYEIAICPSPANPFAIIEKVNTFAKAIGAEDRIQNLDGRCILQCDQIGMCFVKGTNIDNDVDIDNAKVHEYMCVHKGVCDVCGKTKEEHGVEQFDKPDLNKPTGATVQAGTREEVSDSYENVLNSKDAIKDSLKKAQDILKGHDTLVGQSATTRSENIGQAGHSPKDNTDIINSIIKPNSANIKPLQAPKTSSLNKQTVPESLMPKENEDIIPKQGEPVYDSTEDKNGVEKHFVEVEKILPLIAGVLGGAATATRVASAGLEVGSKVAEAGSKVVEAGTKVAGAVSEGAKGIGKMSVHEAINHFGEAQIRKALEELDVIRYIKASIKKYD